MSEEHKSSGKGRHNRFNGNKGGNGTGYRTKQRTEAKSAPVRVKKASNGLVLLEYSFGAESNLHDWLSALEVYTSMKYGRLDLIVSKLERYNPVTAVDLPETPYTDDNDPQGARRTLLHTALQEAQKETSRLKADEAKLFGDIMFNLSTESEHAVKEDATYPSIKSTWDVLELLKLIIKIHTVGPTEDKVQKIINAKDTFYRKTYMNSDESLADFHHKFVARYEQMKAFGVSAIDQEELANTFIRRLYKPSYGEFIDALDKSVIMSNADYPDTLEKAYNLARNWTSKVSRPRGIPNNSVFMTSNPENRGSGNTGRGHGGRGNGGRNNGRVYGRSGRGTPPGTCFNCGESGHWKNECPKKKKNGEEKKKEEEDTKDDSINFVHDEGILLSRKGYVIDKPEEDYELYLDSGSSAIVIGNKNLIRNIRKSEYGGADIHGINSEGKALRADYVADTKRFGTVIYCPQAVKNIIESHI